MKKFETLNLNEDLLPNYDYDGPNDLKMGSLEDTWLVVGSISTPSAQSSFENIVTPSLLDLEVKVAWDLFKTQLTLNWEAWVPHCNEVF